MSYLDRIHAANNADLKQYRRFYIDHHPVGLIWDHNLEIIRDAGLILEDKPTGWHWHGGKNQEEKSRLLAEYAQYWHSHQHISGWRDELYPIASDYGAPVLGLLERAALPILGICGYGVHINGYVYKQKRLHLWIARRAADKATEPNKLDHIAAGGLGYGYSLPEHLHKEAEEEAGIPADYIRHARPAGCISYLYQVQNGIRADELFIYDLPLPEDFHPKNQDGEVASFECMPIEEVMYLVRETEEFKFNCALVLIDFFIRHGFIDAVESDYLELCHLLRNRRKHIR